MTSADRPSWPAGSGPVACIQKTPGALPVPVHPARAARWASWAMPFSALPGVSAIVVYANPADPRPSHIFRDGRDLGDAEAADYFYADWAAKASWPAVDRVPEGTVIFADGSVVSLECLEGRCRDCPDSNPDPGPHDSGPLYNGCFCEHACGQCGTRAAS